MYKETTHPTPGSLRSRDSLVLPRYLVHGVQELGELVEPLPVLAGVLLPLHDGLAQLLDVGHADLVKDRLALQPVLWHCSGERKRRGTRG